MDVRGTVGGWEESGALTHLVPVLIALRHRELPKRGGRVDVVVARP